MKKTQHVRISCRFKREEVNTLLKTEVLGSGIFDRTIAPVLVAAMIFLLLIPKTFSPVSKYFSSNDTFWHTWAVLLF